MKFSLNIVQLAHRTSKDSCQYRYCTTLISWFLCLSIISYISHQWTRERSEFSPFVVLVSFTSSRGFSLRMEERPRKVLNLWLLSCSSGVSRVLVLLRQLPAGLIVSPPGFHPTEHEQTAQTPEEVVYRGRRRAGLEHGRADGRRVRLRILLTTSLMITRWICFLRPVPV